MLLWSVIIFNHVWQQWLAIILCQVYFACVSLCQLIGLSFPISVNWTLFSCTFLTSLQYIFCSPFKCHNYSSPPSNAFNRTLSLCVVVHVSLLYTYVMRFVTAFIKAFQNHLSVPGPFWKFAVNVYFMYNKNYTFLLSNFDTNTLTTFFKGLIH